MKSPTVSVIIPTYNRAATLPRAIDSVIAQTVDSWEIIVIDDGSTDNTSEIIKKYHRELGDRLQYITQTNRGASAARNVGIEAANRPFVAFLDSDDEYVPEKLEQQLALFDAAPDIGLVYCDYAFVDLDAKRHASAFDEKLLLARAVPSKEVSPGLRVCDSRLFETLLRGYFIATITGMIRRDVLGSRIRFDERINYAEEWLFYLQVAKAARAGFVNESLCVHHFTDGSLARTDRVQNSIGLCKVLEAILETFPKLARSERKIVLGLLSRAHRQVAFNSDEAGELGESARRFLRSFRCQPGRATLRSAVAAIVRACFGGGRGSDLVKTRRGVTRSSA
jgi:glycosyltransferase involved in cell wall biosynthesis